MKEYTDIRILKVPEVMNLSCNNGINCKYVTVYITVRLSGCMKPNIRKKTFYKKVKGYGDCMVKNEG